MVRAGKGCSRRDFRRRIKGDKGSDDSDEDYVVSDDQSNASEDFEDLVGFASEFGDLGEFLDENVSNEDTGVNVNDYEGIDGDEEEDEVIESEVKRDVCGQKESKVKASRKRRRVPLEDDDDEDYKINVDEEEEDEEFMPDEDECLEDEEDSIVTKRNKSKVRVCKPGVRKNVAKSGRKPRRKLAPPKNNTRKGGRKIKRTIKKVRYEEDDDSDLAEITMIVEGRGRRNLGRCQRRHVVGSDSDLGVTESSDFEYTISEEEREQVREAGKICGDLIVSPPKRIRSSREGCKKDGLFRSRRAAPSRKTEEDAELLQQRRLPSQKGKQKLEVIKQVCGICLSEEDKRRVQGTLNCCSHYFCFTCIMEWSKVESRCPLCKQRFNTISKSARLTAGVDLRDVVVQVPKRDQIYQPSEEEIRGYLDPYQNVMCMECQQGGDDGLMLLCDICDSPAHTYCVGLGREVPEGNWYCEVCRLGALGSSMSRDDTSDQRTGINLIDGLDLNMPPSPLSFTRGVGSLASPRSNGVINQGTSPFSGANTATLSGRRWIQRHIHHMLTVHRSNAMASGADGLFAAHTSPSPLSSRIDLSRQTWERTPEIGASLENILGERSQETPSSSVRIRSIFHSGQDNSRRQGFQDPTIVLPNNTLGGIFFDEHTGMDSLVLNQEQFPQSTSNINLNLDFTASPDESYFYRVKEQVQSMVRSHLKSLSPNDLGHDDFKSVVRSSTHTILAACGLNHRKTEVHTGLQAPSLECMHSTMVAGGQTSLMKGLCSACFDLYVRNVVESVMKSRSRQWLNLCL
ncbi:hypothetical protein SAY86_000774 [Trapa natans]|uniref:PHD and RING finger domain-containing protein 1 n=1 Tax=Trapa natans TaxID=22666 RepID=A0AAN7MFJ8_TRANT|nr:hypothetical protein SAY86_000774 [Trapa natans]